MLHAGYASGLQEALHGAIFFSYTPGREHCSSRGLWHRISDIVYRGQFFFSHIKAGILKLHVLGKARLLNRAPEGQSIKVTQELC